VNNRFIEFHHTSSRPLPTRQLLTQPRHVAAAAIFFPSRLPLFLLSSSVPSSRRNQRQRKNSRDMKPHRFYISRRYMQHAHASITRMPESDEETTYASFLLFSSPPSAHAFYTYYLKTPPIHAKEREVRLETFILNRIEDIDISTKRLSTSDAMPFFLALR